MHIRQGSNHGAVGCIWPTMSLDPESDGLIQLGWGGEGVMGEQRFKGTTLKPPALPSWSNWLFPTGGHHGFQWYLVT